MKGAGGRRYANELGYPVVDADDLPEPLAPVGEPSVTPVPNWSALPPPPLAPAPVFGSASGPGWDAPPPPPTWAPDARKAPWSFVWLLPAALYGVAIALVPVGVAMGRDANQPNPVGGENWGQFAIAGMIGLLVLWLVSVLVLALAGAALGLALAHQGRLNAKHPDRRPRRTTTPLAALAVTSGAASLFFTTFLVIGWRSFG